MSEGMTGITRDGSVLKGMDKALSTALVARGRTLVVEEGHSLFREGDDATGFYIVKSGGLKATRLSPDGVEQLLAVFSPGDSIGEMGMFDDEPRSATITTLRACSLLYWPKSTFFEFADSNSDLYRHLLGVMARRLRDTNDALAARDFLSLAGQLARMMIRLGTGFGVTLPNGTIRVAHKLTQAEIASMIGASRENVSRVLNQWKREGAITREDGYYHLVDHEALQRFSMK